MKSNVEVLIMAAGSLKNRLHFLKYCFNSPALIPLHVRSVASYVIDFYRDQSIKTIHLAVNEDDLDEVRKELIYYDDQIDYIAIPSTNGVVESLRFALLKLQCQEVIVNLVTTIPTALANPNEVLIGNELSNCRDWSSIDPEANGVKFLSKHSGSVHPGYAFTGVFRSSLTSLRKACEDLQPTNDLLLVIDELHRSIPLHFTKTKWLDCGHELNFYQAKSELITSRNFNSIQIEEIAGIITKSSSETDKFVNEINYIHMLPRNVAVFYPRIINDIKVVSGRAKADMEYYGYPTLSEYLLFWQLEDYMWQRIFHAFDFVLNKHRQYIYSIGRHAYMDFYFSKCTSRVESFFTIAREKGRSYLTADTLTINGESYKNFHILAEQVHDKLEQLYNESDFCIMHGDLCFNNILYDLDSGIIRLIDARGSFGEKCVGIYGDIKYDLAKIVHSSVGGYDYIVNDRFALNVSVDGVISYQINSRENYKRLEPMTRQFISSQGFDYENILFIVGLLFISMCPLHSDSLNRQTVMYVHGIKILNEVLN